jgi:phosphinothricin acetyltransferase
VNNGGVAGRIRRATEADAEAIAAIYEPYVLNSAISFEIEPPNADEIRRRIQFITKSFPWLVCENDSGILSGYAYASAHRERPAYRWATDCTVYVDARNHRQGIGRGLYTSLFELLRHQGYFKTYAGITLPNEGSIGLHTVLGFQPVGIYEKVGYKLGGWRDVAWLVLSLQEQTDNPAEPRPLELLGDETWVNATFRGERFLK